jgi:hypothetical protein
VAFAAGAGGGGGAARDSQGAVAGASGAAVADLGGQQCSAVGYGAEQAGDDDPVEVLGHRPGDLGVEDPDAPPQLAQRGHELFGDHSHVVPGLVISGAASRRWAISSAGVSRPQQPADPSPIVRRRSESQAALLGEGKRVRNRTLIGLVQHPEGPDRVGVGAQQVGQQLVCSAIRCLTRSLRARTSARSARVAAVRAPVAGACGHRASS